MEHYNKLIGSRILDGYEEMLDIAPQPQMLGGARVRRYVLPGSTDADYPGTLAVGTMDGKTPRTMGESFYRDFASGFPKDSLVRGAPRGEAAPSSEVVVGGRRKKSVFGHLMKSIGKELSPMGREVGTVLVKEGTKEGLKEGIRRASADGAGLKRPKAKRMRRPLGADPATYTPIHLLEPSKSGGALLRDDISQFHSSVYPPALASYRHKYSGGARQVSGRMKARGALISQLMRENGLSLGEASKYIKEHGIKY